MRSVSLENSDAIRNSWPLSCKRRRCGRRFQYDQYRRRKNEAQSGTCENAPRAGSTHRNNVVGKIAGMDDRRVLSVREAAIRLFGRRISHAHSSRINVNQGAQKLELRPATGCRCGCPLFAYGTSRQCRKIAVWFSLAFHKELLTFTVSAQRSSGFLLMATPAIAHSVVIQARFLHALPEHCGRAGGS